MARFNKAVDRFEENVLAILMAAITIISFTQVIARYGFNSGWGGALELTRILFAWLILFGMSYGLKIGAHLGVDAVVRLFPKPVVRVFGLFGALATLAYAVILIKSDWLQLFGAQARGGAYDYWLLLWKRPFGLDDLRYPLWMQDTFGLQERVQRWVAYLMLPVGLGLLALRSAQAFWQIATGKRELVVASHEAEELVAENRGALADHEPGEEPFDEVFAESAETPEQKQAHDARHRPHRPEDGRPTGR
ncbi:TRAP transporter small permease [Consotaella salsifontis]|uniref:TRAP transporter small permease protein n=1 Tax=Consotaella salsifontis TaxID=1365950 RepID=A0A1T4MT29_9HYPH|nr:C4-dicarboxylate transporter, DctQ subunit [Consotaella salsifontis]